MTPVAKREGGRERERTSAARSASTAVSPTLVPLLHAVHALASLDSLSVAGLHKQQEQVNQRFIKRNSSSFERPSSASGGARVAGKADAALTRFHSAISSCAPRALMRSVCLSIDLLVYHASTSARGLHLLSLETSLAVVAD